MKNNTIVSVFSTGMVFTFVLTDKPGTVVDEVDRVGDILEKKKVFLTKAKKKDTWKDDLTS